MLDISWTELFVVAVVAILVIGPRDLPRTLRSVGNFVGQARRMAGDFQRQFDQALREAELDEVKKSIDSVRKADPRNQIRDAVKDVAGVGKNLKKDIESAGTGTTTSATGAKSAGKSGADETAAAPAAKTPASKTSAGKTPTAAKPATAKSAATKSTPAKASAKAATTKTAAAKIAKAPARKSTATAKKAAGTARSASAKSGSAAGATGSKTAPAKS